MLDPAQMIVALLAVSLASAAQGLTGFGFSVVAVPALLLVFEPSTVVVLALVLSLVLTVTVLPGAPGRVDVRAHLPLFTMSVVGAVAGGLLLPHLSGPLLRPILGFFAFAGGIAVVFARSLRPIRNEKLALGMTGLVSGLMNGLASLSGPPVAILAIRQRWDAARARKTMLGYSLFVNLVALVALAASHLVTVQRLEMAAVLLPAVFVGRLAGVTGSKRLPAGAYRAVTMALVLFCGIATMGQGIAASLAH